MYSSIFDNGYIDDKDEVLNFTHTINNPNKFYKIFGVNFIKEYLIYLKYKILFLTNNIKISNEVYDYDLPYNYNKEPFINSKQIPISFIRLCNQYISKPILKEYSNCFIISKGFNNPGMVFKRNKEEIVLYAHPYVHYGIGEMPKNVALLKYKKVDLLIKDENVVNMVFNSTTIYHFLIEILPLIVLLNLDELNKYKFIFSGLSKYHYVVLEYIGINRQQIIDVNKYQLIKINKQLIHPLCSIPVGFVSFDIISQFKLFLESKTIRSKHKKRIFISRSKSSTRKISNENEVMVELACLGFESYILEDMNELDKINLFVNAEIVIGTFGGGISNILFSKDINVIEIFPEKYAGHNYFQLANYLKFKYSYIVGKNVVDNQDDKNTNISININELINILKVYI
jgi:hypothetical protein